MNFNFCSFTSMNSKRKGNIYFVIFYNPNKFYHTILKSSSEAQQVVIPLSA